VGIFYSDIFNFFFEEIRNSAREKAPAAEKYATTNGFLL
jgi:hypothetical protein